MRKFVSLLALCVALIGIDGGQSASIYDLLPSSLNSLMEIGQDGFNRTSSIFQRGMQMLQRGGKNIRNFADENIAVLNNATFNRKHDPDRDRNVTQIIRSRGFEAEEYDVVTRDGYILTIQRIINPMIKPEIRAKMKPVIMQHGLMSSSVDFVINSANVKPEVWPKDTERTNKINNGRWSPLKRHEENEYPDFPEDDYDESSHKHKYKLGIGDTQEHPNALGFYMANRGYDVFLTNSRGNTYGRRHTSMSVLNPKFWAFTFDEQIEFDLPDTIEFIQNLTDQEKVGYVGHSQGAVMMFGLLSEKPEYADIVEPFIALAPVAYVNNCLSPVKYFSYLTPIVQHINMAFATPNAAIKYLGPIVCGPKFIKEEICANIVWLSCGYDWDEMDLDRIDAYLGHMPSGTSAKNIAHYGQLVNSGRFAHFDHGLLANQMRYNKTRPPDYDLTKIRSKSIALFIAENDWLASPKDVARLRRDLQRRAKPFAVFNITEMVPLWNHLDFVYAKHAGEIINTRIEQVFKAFENNN